MYSNRGLHIFDSTTSATSLIIQNNNLFTTANTTQGTTTVTGSVTTTSSSSVMVDPTFRNNAYDASPNVWETVTSSPSEKIMIFKTAGNLVNYVFTVPAGGLNCDILMIGGGGTGMFYIGGGAGACIVAINQTLPAGTYYLYVGQGSPANGGNGTDSFINDNNTGTVLYCAKGGAISPGSNDANFAGKAGGCGSGASYNTDSTTENGGAAVSTNVVNGSTATIGPSITSTYAVMGNAGGNNNGQYYTGSGGGIGAAGVSGGIGGAGAYQVTLTGAATPINFRSYFANGGNSFGVQDGTTGNYYIGGGASSYRGNSSGGGTYFPRSLGGGAGVEEGSWVSPIANTGSGGTANNSGASGIIIIRYRFLITTNTTTTTTTHTHQPTTTTTLSTPTLGTPSIELVRGTQGDSNTDYKIGNYNGDFIVKSSVSGVDSDYIRMLGTNGAIYNFTNSLYWTQTSDMRIKENIARASYDMCYDNIDKLELNRFNYIKEFNTGNKDTSQLGFIAQEIKDIFPKSVYTNSYSGGDLSIPDMLSIDIGQINYTLYGAVKKLMDINKDKEMRLKRLECLLNIEDGSCNVVIDSSNLVVDTSNVVVDTSNVMVDTSNVMVVDTSNVMVVDTSNVVVDTSNVMVVDTSNLEN